jgi:hypothetical protein
LETSRLIGAHWDRFREQNGRLGRSFCSLNFHVVSLRNRIKIAGEISSREIVSVCSSHERQV